MHPIYSSAVPLCFNTFCDHTDILVQSQNEFKISIMATVGLLLSQSFTDSSFHFIITSKMATSKRDSMVFQNRSLTRFVLESKPSMMFRTVQCDYRQGCSFHHFTSPLHHDIPYFHYAIIQTFTNFNLLATDFFFQILAHSVFKM